MAEYEEKMLTLLIEAYRKSRKDAGVSVVRRRTQLDPVKLYPGYRRNDGDPDEIEAVNQAAERCRERGFLTYEMNGFSSEIRKLYLTDERVPEVERYLSEHCGYESRQQKKEQVERILEKYSGLTPAADAECKKLRAMLEANRLPKDYTAREQILKALVFIEKNQRPLYLREASMLIYGSSKYLEENTLESVCHILRSFRKRPCGEDELPDEILEEYHIRRDKQKLCVKGAVRLWINGRLFDAGVFRDGLEFFSDDLAGLERIELQAGRFMTVENRASYFRCGGKDTVYFYLGGYTDRSQRDFLRMVYRDNPDARYLHFGDIDAGGFYIFQDLCRKTEIPFSMYRMSVSELQDGRFGSCLQPLTENDRKRLKSLMLETEFQETAEYMLEHGVKLEQEIISYLEETDHR